MVPGQGRQTARRDLQVDNEQRDRLRELVPLRLVVLAQVTEDIGQEILLEGLLEVFVALDDPAEGLDHARDGLPLGRLILQDIDGGALVVQERAAGLDETADKEELEKLLRILEELEGRAGGDELVDERVGGRGFRDEGEVEQERVTESCKSAHLMSQS